MFNVATRPSPRPDGRNEDFALVTNDFAIVVDGAGVPPGLELGCSHGTTWYAENLGAQMAAALVGRADLSLTDALATAITAVNALHVDTCDLSHEGTPSAAVGVVRWRPDEVDVLSLADVSVVLETAEELHVYCDLSIEQNCPPEPVALSGLRLGSPEHAVALAGLVEEQRAMRNREGGFWVAATLPAAAEHAVTATLPRAGIRRGAVLSDGATRPVDQMHIYEWAPYLDLLDKLGPVGLIQHVREIENGDPAGSRYARTKQHDDATVVQLVCTDAP